jgi:hypothetical protein
MVFSPWQLRQLLAAASAAAAVIMGINADTNKIRNRFVQRMDLPPWH